MAHKFAVNKNGEPVYCIYPFVSVDINADGLEVCSWLNPDTNKVLISKDETIKDAWLSDEFENVRECIRNLSYSECNMVECHEIHGDQEFCFTLNELKEKYPTVASYIEGESEKFTAPPIEINLSYDTACNLSCGSCNIQDLPRLSDEEKERYISEIEKMGSNLENLFIAGMGDPFVSKHYRNWLLNFPREKFPKLHTIAFLSNGTRWTRDIWEKIKVNLVDYTLIAQISLDGASKETIEDNRRGSKFEVLMENLAYLSELRKNGELSRVDLLFVVQDNNYKEMPLFVEMAEKFNFDRVSFIRLYDWGVYSKEAFAERDVLSKSHSNYNDAQKVVADVKENQNSNVHVEICF